MLMPLFYIKGGIQTILVLQPYISPHQNHAFYPRTIWLP